MTLINILLQSSLAKTQLVLKMSKDSYRPILQRIIYIKDALLSLSMLQMNILSFAASNDDLTNETLGRMNIAYGSALTFTCKHSNTN